jgi:hypothetical protein
MTAEQEYIITKDELWAFQLRMEGNFEMYDRIRSRPHTPAPDEKHEPRNTIERAEARAARTATLKTLDKVIRIMEAKYPMMQNLKSDIESLRKQEEP